jgi:hypothetical protein
MASVKCLASATRYSSLSLLRSMRICPASHLGFASLNVCYRNIALLRRPTGRASAACAPSYRLSIDKEAWGAIYAASHSAFEIFASARKISARESSGLHRDQAQLRIVRDFHPAQPTATSISLGLAFSVFETCTVGMPSLNSAFTFSASASSGSIKLRTKLAYARSTR